MEAWYGASDPANSGTGNWRYDGFNYDAFGNRAGSNFLANHGAMTFTRKDNGLNEYRAWWPYSIITYDDDIGGTWGAPGAANGVIMQGGWITAGFNALNQPMYIWSANVGWTNFGYDPLGRCVKRWRDGAAATYLYYDGWNLIQEGFSATSPERIYLHGARIDQILCSYQYATGLPLNYYYDALGHCTLVTHTGTGNILEQYDYDAFGQPYFYDGSGTQSPNGSTVGNRFLFTGREYLSDLKLYDYRNRLYQPELGCFMQLDPKEFGAGDYNLYRYCHNDPVNKSDPSGLYVVYSGKWNDADAENFKKIFAEQWNSPEGRQQWEARYNSELPSIVSPYRDAPPAPNGGASNFVIADTKPLSGANPLTPFGQTPKTQPDKRLSDGEIEALKKGDVNPHDLKPAKEGSRYDLFKDAQGNIKVKPKDGSGPGDPTGLNINDFRPFLH